MRFSADNDDVTPFHSSAYANAANGERLGAVSTQSFVQRLHLERNRQHVRHYGHSRLGRGMGEVRPLSMPMRPEQAPPQRIERPAGGEPSQHTFREPPTRYNPYQ